MEGGGWGGPKRRYVTFERRGSAAGYDAEVPPALLGQAPEPCARRIRGGGGRKAGVKSVAEASKEKAGKQSDGATHGTPAIAGRGNQEGETSVELGLWLWLGLGLGLVDGADRREGVESRYVEESVRNKIVELARRAREVRMEKLHPKKESSRRANDMVNWSKPATVAKWKSAEAEMTQSAK